MPEPSAHLVRLAESMGVATTYVDGLGRPVEVANETLVAVCAALGAPIGSPGDARDALRVRGEQRRAELIPPVVVAWDGWLDLEIENPATLGGAEIVLEDSTILPAEVTDSRVRREAALPLGYHELRVAVGSETVTSTVIAAPGLAWRREGAGHRWGVGAQLAALWSSRSRSVGDLVDLRTLAEWVGELGGSLVNLLPLLPTFNDQPAEPSPYSPVSRLFWSELALDLGSANDPIGRRRSVDVARAMAEVRAGLGEASPPDPDAVDPELARYAAFRGAQKQLGRNWRSWPQRPRRGDLLADDVDTAEERFHLTAQTLIRGQLEETNRHLAAAGVGLGLDLAVGVHPDGYDVWSRPDLFATDVSVGAPPDAGFPSGQSWGFPPVHPNRSRSEGHRYVAASIAHHAALADVLRVDHIMAMQRLYWIPDGMDLADGTYVEYPVEEMFAVLCLESHRNRCEVVGENLGTVPPAIDAALDRHEIWGMYVAEFEAGSTKTTLAGPSPNEVAMIDTHDTPLFAGWLEGRDIGERADLGLLPRSAVAAERRQRAAARLALADALGSPKPDAESLLPLLLEVLGASESPLVIIWLEDLWLERDPVNIPGSGSHERPNWVRPTAWPLEQALSDPTIRRRLRELTAARPHPAADAVEPPAVERRL